MDAGEARCWQSSSALTGYSLRPERFDRVKSGFLWIKRKLTHLQRCAGPPPADCEPRPPRRRTSRGEKCCWGRACWSSRCWRAPRRTESNEGRNTITKKGCNAIRTLQVCVSSTATSVAPDVQPFAIKKKKPSWSSGVRGFVSTKHGHKWKPPRWESWSRAQWTHTGCRCESGWAELKPRLSFVVNCWACHSLPAGTSL